MTHPTPRPLLRLLGVLFVFLFALLPLAAQKGNKDFEDYNVRRGLEMLKNDEDQGEALKQFQTALEKNPRNGYAHFFIGLVHLDNDENGNALSAFDLAVKYLPKKDKGTLSLVQSKRALVHLALADTTAALADLGTAIRLAPDDGDYLQQRGDLYYEMERYDLSDRDYEQMQKLDKGNTYSYMGLGRNAVARKDYDRALTLFDRVVQLAPEYGQGYSFRSEVHLLRRDYPRAVEDCTTALSLMDDDVDHKAFQVFGTLCDSAAAPLRARLKVLRNKEPNQPKWPLLLAGLERAQMNYGRAVNYRLEAYALEPANSTTYNLAADLASLNLHEAALSWNARAGAGDSTDIDIPLQRAQQLIELRRYDEAMAALDRAQTLDAENVHLYMLRSIIDRKQKHNDAALEAMDMALSLNEEAAFLHDLRGRLLLKMGQKERADADFRRELALEKTPDDYFVSPFALYFLGQPKAAAARMDSIMAKGDDEQAYNAACIYALCGNKQQALTYLERALKSRAYTDFDHIDEDADLDGLRNDADFKALVKQYRDAWEAHLAAERKLLDPRATEGAKSASTTDTPVKPAAQKTGNKAVAAAPHGVSEIAFTHTGGVTQVPCTINGLPLHFVFDTGASEVTLSSVEALFMFKNGYLKPTDVIGRRAYLTASGDVVEGTSVRLRSVTFGGMTLDNVRASITHSQDAPLLLGQSVLSRLGKVEIDNRANVIRITQK